MGRDGHFVVVFSAFELHAAPSSRYYPHARPPARPPARTQGRRDAGTQGRRDAGTHVGTKRRRHAGTQTGRHADRQTHAHARARTRTHTLCACVRAGGRARNHDEIRPHKLISVLRWGHHLLSGPRGHAGRCLQPPAMSCPRPAAQRRIALMTRTPDQDPAWARRTGVCASVRAVSPGDAPPPRACRPAPAPSDLRRRLGGIPLRLRLCSSGVPLTPESLNLVQKRGRRTGKCPW